MFGFSAPRAGNGQKDFVRLVDTRGQGLSDKNCLNVLKDEGLRKRGRLSIGSDNRRARILQQEIAA